MANGQQNLDQWTAPRGADQAINSSREGGQGALVDEYLQMAVNRPNVSPRPLADSRNTDSLCVKNAGQAVLPQLDIECLQEKRDVIDRQVQAVYDAKADLVIVKVPELIVNAIADGRGHDSIAVMELSPETWQKFAKKFEAERFNNFQRRRTPEVENQEDYIALLNPAEKRVYDYLTAQGLDPRLSFGKQKPTLDLRLPPISESAPTNAPQGGPDERRPPRSSESLPRTGSSPQSMPEQRPEYPGLYSKPPAKGN